MDRRATLERRRCGYVCCFVPGMELESWGKGDGPGAEPVRPPFHTTALKQTSSTQASGDVMRDAAVNACLTD